jgi:uncharacterized protein
MRLKVAALLLSARASMHAKVNRNVLRRKMRAQVRILARAKAGCRQQAQVSALKKAVRSSLSSNQGKVTRKKAHRSVVDAPNFFRRDKYQKRQVMQTQFGIGLRPEHYTDFIAAKQPVDWLEIISDNYLVPGGKPLHYLERIRRDYPVAMHGVALNIGSCDALDTDYIGAIKKLASRIEPVLISDHLCWTGVANQRLHDLLPLPYTQEAVTHVAARIMQVQDMLGRNLVIENVSTYANGPGDLSEAEFVSAIAEAADCELLIDINNIYVSSRNLHFDPIDYLRALPVKRIRQLHLAGHSDYGDHCIDTHDHPVCDDVWNLYRDSIKLWGAIPVTLERDDRIPPLSELIAELDCARAHFAAVKESPHAAA